MLVAMNFGLISRIISAYQPDPQNIINAFCKARTYFGQSSVMSYRWMLTMACIDRYTSSTVNARIRNLANPHIASRVILIIVIIWIIVPWHNWMFLNINGSACVWTSSSVATYNSALVVTFGFIVPTTVMITCAVLINNNLRHKRKRRRNNVSTTVESQANRLLRARDRQTLLMLYVEISFYIICTLPWAIFTTLTTLVLDENPIGAVGAQRLANALQYNTTLTTLDLDNNQIGVVGAQHLADALQNNATLTSLDLGCNLIEDVGAQRLANALQYNTSLTTLDLSSNNLMSDVGTQYIAAALRANTTLTSLDLNCNGIEDIGAQYLVDALQNNMTCQPALNFPERDPDFK
ncbi:unnamed protein product [Adineta steineri]|uniref:G-protein coupled receptors family 1 profile domain-containing protein n=1 Tax=Adineta steineri TaxID=433720 RepID=A0A813ZLN8_9BILA|nr:unnamed protein product [Adineta steineri]CAF0902071.1 unnamed protein product [Adineta steineri]CAF0928695.1 unnamed protein product [Adineta steineri]